MKITRNLGTLLLAGLMAPAGLLYSQGSQNASSANEPAAQRTDPAPTTANPQNTFSKIQDLAQNVRKDVGPLQFKTNGTHLSWKIHSLKLAKVKKSVNQMEKDVNRLESQKASLTPWQQQLLGNVKQDTHELVFQTSAAIKVLNAHHSKMALATTRYPQEIDMISQKANDASHSIGTVFQRHGVDMD